MTEQLCKHFGTCGGCLFQNLPYEEQLKKKHDHLVNLFTDKVGPIPKVIPSPSIWHYRNRLDFNFGVKFYETPPPPGFERETVLGFRARKKWYHLLDINECLIGPKDIPVLLEVTKKWAQAHNLRGFDSRSKRGKLKLLIVREGKRTQQRMVTLVSGEPIEAIEEFSKLAQQTWNAASVHFAISPTLANVAYAEHTELLFGESTITEIFEVPTKDTMKSIRLKISPFGFLQPNTLAAELVYGTVHSWVANICPEVLFDLYGGNGAISILCSNLAEKIISVESVPDTISLCNENALINNTSNITFVHAKVEDYLKNLLSTQEMFPKSTMVIVDPPRAGLHPKARRALLTLGPEYIIYVSCNPPILANEDLPELLNTHEVVEFKAIDMFPHTPHIEVLTLLKKKSV